MIKAVVFKHMLDRVRRQMKHTSSCFWKQKTNKKATISNAPDCSIATDDVRNNTDSARTDCSADAIADAALSVPEISSADVAAVPLAASCIAGAA